VCYVEYEMENMTCLVGGGMRLEMACENCW